MGGSAREQPLICVETATFGPPACGCICSCGDANMLTTSNHHFNHFTYILLWGANHL